MVELVAEAPHASAARALRKYAPETAPKQEEIVLDVAVLSQALAAAS